MYRNENKKKKYIWIQYTNFWQANSSKKYDYDISDRTKNSLWQYLKTSIKNKIYKIIVVYTNYFVVIEIKITLLEQSKSLYLTAKHKSNNFSVCREFNKSSKLRYERTCMCNINWIRTHTKRNRRVDNVQAL